jgi:hypothetical protein
MGEIQERLTDIVEEILSSGLVPVNLSPGATTEFDLVIDRRPDWAVPVRVTITIGPAPYKVVHGPGPYDVDIALDSTPQR